MPVEVPKDNDVIFLKCEVRFIVAKRHLCCVHMVEVQCCACEDLPSRTLT